MRLGMAYPTQEVAGDPDALRQFIKAADELGYDYLLAHDHVLKAAHDDRTPKLTGRWTEEHSFQDPFVLLSYAAALTDKLEFITGVLILPQRQTALVAQQAADLDLLSRERLRLGVGIGWNYVEYEALGQDFHTRGKRIEEQIGLLRQLWSSPLVKFEGQYDRIDRAGVNPRPRRQIPIWLGGYAEASFERAARLGDGFVFAATIDKAVESWDRVKHYLRAHSQSVNEFGADLLALYAKDVQDTVEHIRKWRDIGGTHCCASSTERGLGEDINRHIDFFAKVKAVLE